MDFLDEESLIHSNIGEVGQIPVASQESAIIQDLLYCLIGEVHWTVLSCSLLVRQNLSTSYSGVEGTHIKPKKGSNSVTFSVDKSLDPSLSELLNRIMPLCTAYSNVVRFAEANMMPESGRFVSHCNLQYIVKVTSF